MKFNIGDRVYYNDPDGLVDDYSGYGTIVGIDGNPEDGEFGCFFEVKMEDGNEIECFGHELSERKDP